MISRMLKIALVAAFYVPSIQFAQAAVLTGGVAVTEVCVTEGEQIQTCALYKIFLSTGELQLEMAPGYAVLPSDSSGIGLTVVGANPGWYSQLKASGLETIYFSGEALRESARQYKANPTAAIDKKIARAESTCFWSGVSCGGTLVGLAATQQYWGIPLALIGCKLARNTCEDMDDIINELEKQRSEILEQVAAEKKEAENPGGVANGDPRGGTGNTGAPSQGNPGPSSLDAARNPGGGGSVPCPKCTIKGSGGTPKPKHET